MERDKNLYPTNNPWLVFLKKNQDAMLRLFCFHYGGGSASAFHNWAQYLPDYIELIAVQLPGREGRFIEPCLGSVEELVEKLVPSLAFVLDKPYVVFGHSLGAINSFEVLRSIQKLQLRLPELYIPSGVKAPMFPYSAAPISSLPEEEFVSSLKERYKSTIGNLLDTPEFREVFVPQLRADFNMIESYRYSNPDKVAFDFPIVALAGTEEHLITEQHLASWADLTTQDFLAKRFSGGHFFVQSQESKVVNFIVSQINNIKEKIHIAA